MTLALVDCPTGLAGNMLLAALLDLGLPESVLHRPLVALGLDGAYSLAVEERRSAGLRGLHLEVRSLEADPPHRHWCDLRDRIVSAPLEESLRQRVLQVFSLLAEAEAAVHGCASDAVHFHEVGAVDALVDIVGVCAGLQHFGIERLICGVPPAGHGRVISQHGPLPLPAPAVLELARRLAIPLASSEGFPEAELTTPTGLALMGTWANGFGVAPGHRPRAVGVGLGSRSLDRPNLLRLVLAQPIDAAEPPGQPRTGARRRLRHARRGPRRCRHRARWRPGRHARSRCGWVGRRSTGSSGCPTPPHRPDSRCGRGDVVACALLR